MLPSSPTYLSRARLSARQIGSRGTLTSSHGRASAASVSSPATGSARCSSTSQQTTSSAASARIEASTGAARNAISTPAAAAAARLVDHLPETSVPRTSSPPGEQDRELALAAADLVRLARAGARGELAELPEEAADEPALDRVRVAYLS